MASPKLRAIVLNALVLLAMSSVLKAQEVMQSPLQKLVVVELFQSQGCSSCPPAEANLNALANEPGVLALSYDVTYWDDLGWKDTFATNFYTQRQWNYAHYRGRDSVWTPQVYINGHTDVVGTDRTQLVNAIAKAQSSGPAIQWSGGMLIVNAAANAVPADVWLVRYDPRTLQVAIGGGENSGRTLPQRNVVRELKRLGSWDGEGKTFPIPDVSIRGLKTAALVQARSGGDILSASVQQGLP